MRRRVCFMRTVFGGADSVVAAAPLAIGGSVSDVVFVYLGDKLPRYVIDSVILAKQLSGQRVILIGDGVHGRKMRGTGVDFFALGDFYNPNTFAALKGQVILDHEFRDGFWLKTFERFFVLEQYMAWSSSSSVFHAELDQLLFQTSELVNRLESLDQKGLFFPFHSPSKAVASVFFINSIDALHRLLAYAAEGEPFEHEMELLVRFSRAFPEDVISLPTVGSALPDRGNTDFTFTRKFLSPSELGDGVVDAAELGLWVGGRDPRNLPFSSVPRTKWTYGSEKVMLGSGYLRDLRFSFRPEVGKLEITSSQSGGTAQLYNLHLQSKIHRWLRKKDPDLRKLFDSANSEDFLEIPFARRTQIFYLLSAEKGLHAKLGKVWKLITVKFLHKIRGGSDLERCRL